MKLTAWIVIPSTLLLLAVICCGGFLYRNLTFHLYTYETTEPLAADVSIRINPQTRMEKPSRLVGPPYGITINLKNPPISATEVALHWLTITTDDGRVINAKISKSIYKIRDESWGRFVVLYALVDAGDWGQQPTLEAKYEVMFEGSSTTETLRVRLQPEHKISENIVSAV